MNEPIPMDASRETLLALQLDHLARELATHSAPHALESVLAARFRAQNAARRPAFWWIPPLALAAAVMLVSWVVRAPEAVEATPPPPSRAATADSDGPFLALRPLERIALDGTTIVDTQFPRALLADWGLPVAPERAAEPVHAQMLYSAEGEPLAVRLVK